MHTSNNVREFTLAYINNNNDAGSAGSVSANSTGNTYQTHVTASNCTRTYYYYHPPLKSTNAVDSQSFEP